MIKETDEITYTVSINKTTKIKFKKYSDALEFALAHKGLWIDVGAIGEGFALSATVSKIVNGKVVDIHPEYKIG